MQIGQNVQPLMLSRRRTDRQTDERKYDDKMLQTVGQLCEYLVLKQGKSGGT